VTSFYVTIEVPEECVGSQETSR